jgi:hypothetical protein
MKHADSDRPTRTESRRGDVVRVRSREEILGTLDPQGATRSLPFMPEMLKFCGQELSVSARADKSCDTLHYAGNRHLERTVHLVGARCDGSAHGGCQAACNLFWREEWLEWPDAPGKPIAAPTSHGNAAATEETLRAATKVNADDDGPYRCQATEHTRASTLIPRHNYSQYLRDVRIGNATVRVVIRGLLYQAFRRYQRLSLRFLPRWMLIRGGREAPFWIPTGNGERVPETELKPGDLVEVRSKDEIMATLAPDGRNRNLFFDAEMLPYCGRRARVTRRVTQILDENSGKMIKLSDCYVLEDVICLGIYHQFCPRAITPYWRSAWLRKVDESLGASPPLPGVRLAGAKSPDTPH